MHAVNDVKESATEIFNTAKDRADQVTSSARSTMWDAVKTVTGVVSMLRGLGVDDVLTHVGLARRRPGTFIATFGAGVAIGAGLGVMFAPKSGLETRKMLVKRFAGIGEDAKETVQKVEAKADGIAHDAKQVALKVEHEVEHRASDIARNVGNTTGPHRVS